MRFINLTLDQAQRRLHVTDVQGWAIVVDALMHDIRPGFIIALSGPLGAGKTTLVQQLATALGVDKLPPSPTFALMRTYALPTPVNGVKRLIHVDAYRIEDEKDLLPLDLDAELADGASVLVVEWPEKIKSWLSTRRHALVEITTSG